MSLLSIKIAFRASPRGIVSLSQHLSYNNRRTFASFGSEDISSKLLPTCIHLPPPQKQNTLPSSSTGQALSKPISPKQNIDLPKRKTPPDQKSSTSLNQEAPPEKMAPPGEKTPTPPKQKTSQGQKTPPKQTSPKQEAAPKTPRIHRSNPNSSKGNTSKFKGSPDPNPSESKGSSDPDSSEPKGSSESNPREPKGSSDPNRKYCEFFGEFFAKYPTFPWNPKVDFFLEFQRMCLYFKWGRGNTERKAAKEAFNTAVVQCFGKTFGNDYDDPEAWKKLCLTAGINPVPESIKERMEAIMSIHINLVDMLVEARMGRTSKQYTSLKELRAYTITEKKYIRRTSIPPKSLLNYLLREIHMNKYNGFRRKSEDAPKEKEG